MVHIFSHSTDKWSHDQPLLWFSTSSPIGNRGIPTLRTNIQHVCYLKDHWSCKWTIAGYWWISCFLVVFLQHSSYWTQVRSFFGYRTNSWLGTLFNSTLWQILRGMQTHKDLVYIMIAQFHNNLPILHSILLVTCFSNCWIINIIILTRNFNIVK